MYPARHRSALFLIPLCISTVLSLARRRRPSPHPPLRNQEPDMDTREAARQRMKRATIVHSLETWARLWRGLF